MTLLQTYPTANVFSCDGVQTVWNFSFTGGYIDQAHVKAVYTEVSGAVAPVPLNSGMFIGPYQLSITPALVAGGTLTLYRSTPKELPLVDFADGARISEASLDIVAKQSVFVASETLDGFPDIRLVNNRANKLWSFDADGNFAVVSPSEQSASALALSLAGSNGSSQVGVIAAGTGAVTRTVQSKLRDLVSVFDFLTPAEITAVEAGASALDVTTGVQAALTAAAGRELFFPEGVYYCTAALTVYANTTLTGGRGAKLRFLDGAYIGLNISTQRVTVQNLLIYGTHTTAPTITLLKNTGAGAYLTVSGCEFAYGSIAVLIAESYVVKLIGNSYSNCDTYVKAITTEGPTADLLLMGETFGTPIVGTTNAIVDLQFVFARLTGCYFENQMHTKHSVLVRDIPDDPGLHYAITGCQFFHSGSIFVTDEAQASITGNTFFRSYHSANNYTIRVGFEATAVISGNSFSMPSLVASLFCISASGMCATTGNRIHIYSTGISQASGSISANIINNCTTGINIGSGSSVVVVGNYLTSNTTDINQNGGGPNIVAMNHATTANDSTDNGTFIGNSSATSYLRVTEKGSTASRPTLTTNMVGVQYFDTTLDVDGKPIWWTGTAWVDGVGAVV